MNTKRDIKSLSHDELEELMNELGQPRYRAKQIEEWLYARGVSSIDKMDNLPKALRQKLNDRFFVGTLSLITKQVSEDGTRKYLFRIPNGALVETVGIPSHDGNRLTVCFSSQAGCPMGCTFCATGRSGFTCNLTSGEMFDQVKYVGEDFGRRVTNVVCMGQGEPFLNYEAVLEALRRMNSKVGLGIGARHITVSTCGILEGIDNFLQEPEQFTLAISLHSAKQETRDKIMPGVRNAPLDELRKELIRYAETTGRRPSFEFALMKDVNDTDDEIQALVDYCKGMLCHVNLIPLNPIDESDDDPSLMEPSSRLKEVSEILTRNGIENSIRDSRGQDIDGACGQLRQRVME